jgi:hypothetical protein
MKGRTMLSTVLALMGCLCLPMSAHAQSVSGTYTSNMGNKMILSGNSYHYIYAGSTPGQPKDCRGSISITSSGVQFEGSPQPECKFTYFCSRNGPRLVCDGGRRVWLRQ